MLTTIYKDKEMMPGNTNLFFAPSILWIPALRRWIILPYGVPHVCLTFMTQPEIDL